MSRNTSTVTATTRGEYRKVEGKWLISYRKLTRLRETHTPNFFDYMGAL